MNEKQIAEIDALYKTTDRLDKIALLHLVAHIPALIAEVRRLRAVLAEYAAPGNWSPFDEHGMNPSEWLPEQEGWLRAARALKDGEQ